MPRDSLQLPMVVLHRPQRRARISLVPWLWSTFATYFRAMPDRCYFPCIEQVQVQLEQVSLYVDVEYKIFYYDQHICGNNHKPATSCLHNIDTFCCSFGVRFLHKQHSGWFSLFSSFYVNKEYKFKFYIWIWCNNLGNNKTTNHMTSL